MKASPCPSSRPKLVITKSSRPNLGDMLQRLALIAPNDLVALARLTADVLRVAEEHHRRAYPHFDRDRDAC